jgi:hypothetical protein
MFFTTLHQKHKNHSPAEMDISRASAAIDKYLPFSTGGPRHSAKSTSDILEFPWKIKVDKTLFSF